MTYTQLVNGGVLRNADGAFIPARPGNAAYEAYLLWVAAGNVAPLETPTAPLRETTKLAIYARMTDAEIATLDAYLRTTATTRQRLSWNDAVSIYLGNPDLIQLGAALFGATRAQELLG